MKLIFIILTMFRFYIYHPDLDKPQRLKYDPVGWDTLGKTVKRDMKWHGVFFEYTPKLKFVKDGKNLVQYFYEKYGIEAELLLIITKYNAVTRVYDADYTGRFNLHTYKVDDLYVECNIEQTGFLQKLKNRQDVKVDLKSLVTQSGKAIAANANETTDVELHSKILRKVYDAHQTTGVPFDGDAAEASQYIQFELDTVNLDEIDEKFDLEWGLNGSIPVNQFKITEAGEHTFKLRLEASRLDRNFLDASPCNDTAYNMRSLGGTFSTPLGGPYNGGDITLYIKKNAEAAIAFSRANFSTTPPAAALGLGVFQSTVFTYLDTLTLAVDDIITIYADITTTFDITASTPTVGSSLIFWGKDQPTGYYNPVKVGCSFSGFGQDLLSADFEGVPSQAEKPIEFIVTADTTVPATTAPLFLKHEALARIIESITDEADSFRSEYYGRTDSEPTAYAADGEGSLRGIASGKIIRGFPFATNTTHANLKDALETCMAIDGVGLGIETSGIKQRVRIEKLEYFYSPVRVAQFPYVKNIEKVVADDSIYNELEIGYDKALNESINNLDEFNTRREFALPITQVKNRLVLIAPWSASGYTIEFLRRDPYVSAASKDNERDNNVIIIQLRRESGDLVTDKDEDFAALNNLISPETVYNAKLSVMRNIKRNGPLIRSGLYHQDDKQIKLAFGEGNTAYSSRLTSETSVLDETVIAVEDLGQALWLPEIYRLKHKPTRSQLEAITANPYGIIEFSATNKNWKKGWLIEQQPDAKSGLISYSLLRANV